MRIACLLLLSAAALQAHPEGHGGTGFGSGFTHPLGGLDHLLAMVAVGIWAVQLGGRALWIVPLSFVGAMLIGGTLGAFGFTVLLVEQGIALSVLLLGLAVAFALRPPIFYPAILVAAFALLHGAAHGAEMPPSAGLLGYALGFTFATALLHGCGIVLAEFLARFAPSQILRGLGAATAVAGLAMLVAI